MEAAHPVPDAAGIKAAQALKTAVTGLGQDDLVVALICGGGSSLLPDPPAGLDLADLQALNEALLASGGINGGRLAELAAPAQVCSLIVSDVPGDAAGEVASGPTVAGRPVPRDVHDMILARGIALPARLMAHLEKQTDSPAPDIQDRAQTHIIASAALSLEAAASAARAKGVNAWVLSDRIEGEARDVAQVHAALARQVAQTGFPHSRTCCPAVWRRNHRHPAFSSRLHLPWMGLGNIQALAADTDGIDGSETNAGAFVDGRTADRMRVTGADPQAFLQKNNAYSAFEAVGDLFITGPTGTNVNDFRAILIGDVPRG
ncbi:putative hydroxypyruvate reductase [Nymphon striatum]|nr:putative hydroxypyruvate reductase [Nymphon striatum]